MDLNHYNFFFTNSNAYFAIQSKNVALTNERLNLFIVIVIVGVIYV